MQKLLEWLRDTVYIIVFAPMLIICIVVLYAVNYGKHEEDWE